MIKKGKTNIIFSEIFIIQVNIKYFTYLIIIFLCIFFSTINNHYIYIFLSIAIFYLFTNI